MQPNGSWKNFADWKWALIEKQVGSYSTVVSLLLTNCVPLVFVPFGVDAESFGFWIGLGIEVSAMRFFT